MSERVASSAFQNMRPYFYGYLLARGFLFLCRREDGCIRLRQSNTLTRKHYLVSMRHKIVARVSPVNKSL